MPPRAGRDDAARLGVKRAEISGFEVGGLREELQDPDADEHLPVQRRGEDQGDVEHAPLGVGALLLVVAHDEHD